jgi:hypothetical protein
VSGSFELTEEELSVMELALLFKIPLYKLLEEMPYEEYLAWLKFFKKRPPGAAEDYRAAVIVSALSKDVQIDKLFPSLSKQEKIAGSVGEKLEGSKMLSFIHSATNGDKIGD